MLLEFLNVKMRLCPYVCTIRLICYGDFFFSGDGSGSFIVSGSANPSTRLVRRAAKYSVALQYLVFEEMLTNEDGTGTHSPLLF